MGETEEPNQVITEELKTLSKTEEWKEKVKEHQNEYLLLYEKHLSSLELFIAIKYCISTTNQFDTTPNLGDEIHISKEFNSFWFNGFLNAISVECGSLFDQTRSTITGSLINLYKKRLVGIEGVSKETTDKILKNCAGAISYWGKCPNKNCVACKHEGCSEVGNLYWFRNKKNFQITKII